MKDLKKQLNKFVTIQFKKKKNAMSGLLLQEGKHWLLLHYVPVDYVMDGFLLVNREKIKKIQATEKEAFTTSVISLKKEFTKKPEWRLNLSSEDAVYNKLIRQKELVQIETASNDSVYIGQFSENGEQDVVCNTMGVRGNWAKERSLKKTRIFALLFDNDYVNSLKAYNRYLTEQEEEGV